MALMPWSKEVNSTILKITILIKLQQYVKSDHAVYKKKVCRVYFISQRHVSCPP